MKCASCKTGNYIPLLEEGKKFICFICKAENVIIHWGGGFTSEIYLR